MNTRFKTFIINMKKDSDRLAFMSDQLRKLNIDFTLQEGIDGKKHDFSGIYDEALTKKINGSPMADTEKGCALSHRLAVEKLLSSNENYGLIMEDDIELPENFKNIIERELEKREAGKTSWEYLSFNYPPVGWRSSKLWLFLFSSMFKRNKKSFVFYLKLPIFLIKFISISILYMLEGARESVYKIIYKNGKPALFYRPLYLAGCYLINKEGAKKLLSVNDKLVYTADRLPNVARVEKGLKFYAFIPLLVYQRQDKFRSNNVPEVTYLFK